MMNITTIETLNQDMKMDCVKSRLLNEEMKINKNLSNKIKLKCHLRLILMYAIDAKKVAIK